MVFLTSCRKETKQTDLSIKENYSSNEKNNVAGFLFQVSTFKPEIKKSMEDDTQNLTVDYMEPKENASVLFGNLNCNYVYVTIRKHPIEQQMKRQKTLYLSD